jgi:UrcA family protein
MYTMKRSRVLMAGLACLMLNSVTSAALASQTFSSVPRVVVHYGELDLSRAEGARVLYKRIQRAAFRVCERSIIPVSIRAIKTSACYQDAIAKAVADVNNAQLYSIHQTRITRVASE